MIAIRDPQHRPTTTASPRPTRQLATFHLPRSEHYPSATWGAIIVFLASHSELHAFLDLAQLAFLLTGRPCCPPGTACAAAVSPRLTLLDPPSTRLRLSSATVLSPHRISSLKMSDRPVAPNRSTTAPTVIGNGHMASVGDSNETTTYEHGVQVVDEQKEFK